MWSSQSELASAFVRFGLPSDASKPSAACDAGNQSGRVDVYGRVRGDGVTGGEMGYGCGLVSHSFSQSVSQSVRAAVKSGEARWREAKQADGGCGRGKT